MKVLLIATVQSHICQFHKPIASMLHEAGAKVHVAARNNLAEKNGLTLDFADKVFDIPFSRSPKSKDNITAYKQLKKIIDEEKYDVVHCNTPMGGIVTRLAARKARKKGTKVFYTAHGFHFYKGASKKAWAVFYPIEKFFAKHYTDKLITIVKEDYELAVSKFKTDVHHIHGVGVNSQKYFDMPQEQKEQLKENFGYKKEDKLLLCVGELNKNKNQKTLIHAFAEVLKNVPDCKLLLAGNGPERQNLIDLVNILNIQNNVDFLGYTLELDKYLNISDIAISLSHREGLPFNIMEAMLCKKPIIASYNRGHNELIKNDVNGALVNSDNIEGVALQITRLLNNGELCKKYSDNSFNIVQQYTDTAVSEELKNIYFN